MQEVKNYITEQVEEEVYADVETTSTTYGKVVGGKIRDGFNAVIVALAVSYSETIIAYVKKKDKNVYADGLNCMALSNVAQTAGIGDEVPLYIALNEGDTWELGFKATAATPKVNWRIRIRLFKKGA